MLVLLVIADLGYRRFLLFERRLDEPIAVITPGVPVTFSKLRATELEEYLRFHDQVPEARVAERFAGGDECFVARHEGRIVGASWVSRDAHFYRSVRCRYPVGPSEVYLYDSFTDPSYRGRAIAPALGVHVLEQLREAGVTRVTMAIAPENASNRRARSKTGFQPFGRIDYLRLGCRSWHWHRTIAGRSPGLRARSAAPPDPA